jgi:hypothetical protein
MTPEAYLSETYTPARLHIGAHRMVEGVHRAYRQTITIVIFPLNV